MHAALTLLAHVLCQAAVQLTAAWLLQVHVPYQNSRGESRQHCMQATQSDCMVCASRAPCLSSRGRSFAPHLKLPDM